MTQGNRPPLVKRGVAEKSNWAARGKLVCTRRITLFHSFSSFQPDQVIAMTSQDQQQAALALLLASRSGSGFLHDMHHRCGDLSRIAAPTLIIASQYDGSVDSSHATYAADHIARAE